MGVYSEDVVLIVTQQPKTAKIAIGEEKSQFFLGSITCVGTLKANNRGQIERLLILRRLFSSRSTSIRILTDGTC